jgi:MoxR-like ATPase
MAHFGITAKNEAQKRTLQALNNGKPFTFLTGPAGMGKTLIAEAVGLEHTVEGIIGDLDDLVGPPITMAEEVTQNGEETDWGLSTWAFYKLATNQGYVTIRWFGEPNGYYS